MYIDGESRPSMNYTRTEDYFCGSYGFGNDIAIKQYQTYSAPYAGLYAILGDTRAQYNAQKRFMCSTVVEKVYVHQTQRNDGQKVQRLQIVNNCMGEFQA